MFFGGDLNVKVAAEIRGILHEEELRLPSASSCRVASMCACGAKVLARQLRFSSSSPSSE
jgi:hypothetical protein